MKMPTPRVAYILLWFPEPSQTFVLEEVNTLVRLGLEIQVYCLYGPRPAAMTAGMAPGLAPVSHLGWRAAGTLFRGLLHLDRDWGAGAGQFLRQTLFRRWRSLETAASLVRVNTRANAGYLAGLAPGEAAKIVTIYNGVSLPPQPAPARSWGPPFRLLALGRLVGKKGYAVLLAACRLLAQDGVDFRLTLGGEGPERRKLQRLIAAYGLKGQVTLAGFVPHREVPRLLAAADLFLMPSIITPSGDRDGIPNVVLEALLHEVPVVASRVSGLPEVIRPGETGWLVKPADPESLAAAIQEVFGNPVEARRRALAGRDLVAREFDSVRNYGQLKARLEGLG